jgi:hypothetical protein
MANFNQITLKLCYWKKIYYMVQDQILTQGTNIYIAIEAIPRTSSLAQP